MIKKKIIETIEIHAGECPYDAVDLMDRVANDRIMSAGQKRWIQEILNDSKYEGLRGNANAAKADGEKRTSIIAIPVTQSEKAAVVKAAGGRKLSEYCREKLRIGK